MRKLLWILAAAMLVVAACGDDDASDTAADDTEVVDDGEGDDSGDDGSDDSDDSQDDSDDGDLGDAAGFLGDDRCDFVLSGAWANPFGAGASPDGSIPQFSDLGDQFEAMADEAPEEIRDEFHVLADRFQQLGDLIGDVDMSDPQAAFQDPQVQQAFAQAEEIFDDEFQAASETVADYFEDHCDF